MSLQLTLKKIYKMLENREHEKVILYCNNALEIYHNDADVLSARGEAKFAIGKVKDAFRDIDEAAKLEPKNPFRYSSRAFVREKLGETKEAIEDYKKALELDPTDATIQNNLGLLEEKLGYEIKAKKRFDLADELYQLDQKSNTTSSEIRTNKNDTIVNEKRASVILKVFTDPIYRKEFFQFLKNGLRKK